MKIKTLTGHMNISHEENGTKNIFILPRRAKWGQESLELQIGEVDENNTKVEIVNIDAKSIDLAPEKMANTLELIENYFSKIELNSGLKKIIVIKEVIDHLSDNDLSQLFHFFSRKMVDKDDYLVIMPNSASFIKAIKSVQDLSDDPIKHVDFKVIANDHKLTWDQLYINTFWNSVKFQRGKVTFDKKVYKINSADVAALIIASRYWGKASSIFDMQTNNTNKNFFKPITVAFFHNTSEAVDFSTLVKEVDLRGSFDEAPIVQYLANYKTIAANLSAFSVINLNHFMTSIEGRHLLEKNKAKLDPATYSKYFSVISSFAHSVDFLIVELIVNDSTELEEIVKKLRQMS